MSNLINAIAKLNNLIAQGDISYVYFEKTHGEVFAITNNPIDSEYDVIEVNHDEVKEYFLGRAKISEYVVKYNHQLREYVIAREVATSFLKSVEDYLYQIPFEGNTFDNLEKIYVGINFRKHNATDLFYKGDHVWANNEIYKLHKDFTVEDTLDTAELFLENIVSVDKKSIPLMARKNRKGHKVLVDNQLYMINSSDDTSVYIFKNDIAKQWQFYSTKDIVVNEKLLDKEITDKVVMFFITEPDDPNILIRTIEIPIKDLIDKTKCIFPYMYESEEKNLSIFTPRLYRNYRYEVVK